MRTVFAWMLSMAVVALAATPAMAVDYARDVKPIFRAHCMNCHGPLRQKGGLRLDHVKFIRDGGDSGPAIAALANDSLLVHAVSGAADVERMPLEAKPLSDEAIATLRAWIDEGAPRPTSHCRPIRASIGPSESRRARRCPRWPIATGPGIRSIASWPPSTSVSS